MLLKMDLRKKLNYMLAAGILVMGSYTNAQAGIFSMAEKLIPFVAPMVTQAVTKIAQLNAKALSKLNANKCRYPCQVLSKATCATPAGNSGCKKLCQEKIDVGGGYEFKIRFAESDGHAWSLKDCVTRAKEKNVQEEEPKSEKSIAIYGQANLETATEVVANIVALDQFILLQGRHETTKGKSKEEIEDLVADAKAEKERLKTAFNEYVKENFGPQ